MSGLGASLQSTLSVVKADPTAYPSIDVHYSQSEPLTTPVIVSLPQNGIRLRFDGADQRLRLIEIMDFCKVRIAYKGSELVKMREDMVASSGPAFKRVYQIFGAAFPGEYMRPSRQSSSGTYVLSWPGIAFSFPLQHSAWSPDKDHVSLLGSHAASAASHMAIYEGNSWSEARKDIFVRTPARPRSIHLAGRSKESLPVEVEGAVIRGNGLLELMRRPPARPFTIKLNETTPQDLVTEMGPPDTTHKRDQKSFAAKQPAEKRKSSAPKPMTNGRVQAGSLPSSYSSTGTDTFETDFDSEDPDDDPAERENRETFWSYFSHGVDILVGPPTNPNSTAGGHSGASSLTPLATSPHLVVTKIIIHGNVPGSYAFNRHRRLRWTLDLVSSRQPVTSESKFESLVKPHLLRTFSGIWPESEMARGKVVNRTWGASPTDSSFFLPDAGEDLVEGGGSEQWLGNTRLYQFPGLVFEVLESGAVIAVTVC